VGKFERDENSEEARATSEMGSSYVPLDSWIYAAFDRLAALGYVADGSAVVRPWTRLECARLLKAAYDASQEADDLQIASRCSPRWTRSWYTRLICWMAAETLAHRWKACMHAYRYLRHAAA